MTDHYLCGFIDYMDNKHDQLMRRYQNQLNTSNYFMLSGGLGIRSILVAPISETFSGPRS